MINLCCLKGWQRQGEAVVQFPLLTSSVVVLFSNVSRFPVLLQFHIKAKRATYHCRGL